MLTVRGLPILVDELEILQTIREQVFREQNRTILSKIKRSGNNIMVCCPNHGDGMERKPSCGISLVDKKGHPAGTAHCFACQFVANFSQFVSVCFGYNDNGAFGEQWLLENFVTGEAYERPSLLSSSSGRTLPQFLIQHKPSISYVSEAELASYRFYHPYMWKRKLTPEIVEKYDVGYQKDFVMEKQNEDGTVWKSSPIEVLTFPCRDKDGNCLFVSRRAIHTKDFFLPLNLNKPVYGIYELPKDCKEVVICESVFNALTCAVYGVPAVALFGTGNEYQYEILNKMDCRSFKIGLDPDSAGNKGAYKLKKHLKGKLLYRLQIPAGKDINDLTYDEFMNLQEIIM